MSPWHEPVRIGKSLFVPEKFDLGGTWVPAFAGKTTKRMRLISILSQPHWEGAERSEAGEGSSGTKRWVHRTRPSFRLLGLPDKNQVASRNFWAFSGRRRGGGAAEQDGAE